MRIAVLLRDRCQPKKCSSECINYCPINRGGAECIVPGKKKKPVISEELCVGCGICINKCPFDAIRIIGLPEALEQEMVHKFGKNGFSLFRLPTPKKGRVLGLLGPNGIGKTTAVSILAGEVVPNLGNWEDPPGWEGVLSHFAGTELHDYLQPLSQGGIRTSLKPQYVDKLPAVASGTVRELLGRVDGSADVDGILEQVDLSNLGERDIGHLSGGELQRLAIGAALAKDADIYFFDEPSSYLDIYQRLRMARLIQRISQEKVVVVIEHDLAVLDFLADMVHLMYGEAGAYGVFAHPRPVRASINTYLSGFLKEENVRFRDKPIKFFDRPPRTEWTGGMLEVFPELEKDLGQFKLKTDAGVIHEGESVGVVGPNATGKTTFVKMLAGELKPDRGNFEGVAEVSYKPQYINPEFGGTVMEFLYTELGEEMEAGFFRSEIEHPLELRNLYMRELTTLSGGELQRVALAACLARKADLYLIDEPSAYLDSNQRMEAARTIRRVMEKGGTSALIVDHDVYFLDLVSDTFMVFSGEPAVEGRAQGPLDIREGMNMFLSRVGITFRRDTETLRPRINKEGSRLDREQKQAGEYYFSGE